MRRVLVDTGPLVALFDRGDRNCGRCLEVVRGVPPPLLTTWPVITEAVYLLGFSRSAQEALFEMLERGAMSLLDMTVQDVPPIRTLMHKYRDLPMDLADATLVRAAEREGIHEVFTLDRRDFSIYRVGRNKTLTLLP